MGFSYGMRFPVHSEFIMLYLGYIAMCIYLVRGLITSKRKFYFRLNTFLFVVYTVLTLIMFSDEDNFRHGGTLFVLFYSALFVLIHTGLLLLYGLIRIVRNIFKK